MNIAVQHTVRVYNELRAAGMTRFGLAKFSSHYLPNVIHHDEHIQAVIYGRHTENSLLFLEEAMLVATDHRVIFIDHKPGFTNTDEFSYDVISGVRFTQAGFFTSVTLHTKVGDFTLRYVNNRCAKNFVRYIEDKRLRNETVINYIREEQHVTPASRNFRTSRVPVVYPSRFPRAPNTPTATTPQ
jgi:hypothetical protein